MNKGRISAIQNLETHILSHCLFNSKIIRVRRMWTGRQRRRPQFLTYCLFNSTTIRVRLMMLRRSSPFLPHCLFNSTMNRARLMRRRKRGKHSRSTVSLIKFNFRVRLMRLLPRTERWRRKPKLLSYCFFNLIEFNLRVRLTRRRRKQQFL